MQELLNWIETHAGTLGILIAVAVAVVPPVWAFARYLNLRSKQLQHERFRIYHDLIRDLVQPEAPGMAMSLDRQIAIVFELRHFPEYYELTFRMLEGLQRTWAKARTSRLTEEIRLTMDYIASRTGLRAERPAVTATHAD